MKRWELLVLLSAYALVLVACGGSSSETDNPSLGAEQALSGRVTYDFVPVAQPEGASTGAALDYSAAESRPVRGAQVLLLNEHGDVLKDTVTDHDGEYRFDVSAQMQVQVRVLAAARREGTPAWDVEIQDNTQGNALYALDGAVRSTGEKDSRRDLHAASGWNDNAYNQPRAAAPFAVLDTLYKGQERILERAPEQIFPPLIVYWSSNNRPAEGDVARGEIGTSYYLDGDIYLLGAADFDTDEFDRHVVMHEWGHYLEHRLYRSDTPGGPHSRQSLLDMRVAFSEGFANAFAAMMLDDPEFRDTQGSAQARGGSFVVGEEGHAWPRGWYSQVSVGNIVYRYYASEDNQRDYDLFHQALSDPGYRQAQSLASIYLFAHQVHQYRPGALDEVLLQEQVFGTSQWGAGETNDGGDNASLPVYRVLIPTGDAEYVCSDAQHGQYNTLLNRQYVTFGIEVAGEYTLELEAENSTDADLGYTLFKRGEIMARSEQQGLSQLQQPVELAPGEYVVEVYDWRNLDADTPGVDVCFFVRLHP